MKIIQKKYDIISITWPLYIESFLNLLLSNINILMLSHFSPNAVGAVGVANNIIFLIGVLYNVVSIGTIILVSQNIGAENLDKAKVIAEVALLINLLLGIVLSLMFFIFPTNLLILMNLPEEMMSYGVLYLKCVGGISFVNSAIITQSAVLRSYGYTKYPMKVIIFMNIISVTGSYLSLFSPFNLPLFGIQGMITSIIISYILGLLIISLITNKNLQIKLRFNYFIHFPVKESLIILRTGGPAAGEYISYSITQIFLMYIINRFGTYAINAKIFVQNISAFVTIASFSISQGTQIVVSYLKGSKKNKEIWETSKNSLLVSFLCNFFLSSIIFIFSSKILGLFTKDPVVIKVGVIILLIDIIVESGRSINHITMSSLRGAGDIKTPVIISIMTMWCFGILFSFILGISLNLSIIGVYIASAIDEWLRAIILRKRWNSGKWEKIKILCGD